MRTVTTFQFTVGSFETEEDFKKKLEDFIWRELSEEPVVDISHDSKGE